MFGLQIPAVSECVWTTDPSSTNVRWTTAQIPEVSVCVGLQTPYLAVGVHHGPQQLPGAPPAVHADHAEDLQEAQAAERRRRKDVALATGRNHGNRGDEHDDVWGHGLKVEGGSIIHSSLCNPTSFIRSYIL